MEKYLRGLLTPESTAKNAHEAAIELQREYENLVSKETEIKTGASKGKSKHVSYKFRPKTNLKAHEIVNKIILLYHSTVSLTHISFYNAIKSLLW